MATKKNQHWVPRFYLNAFAIPETRGTKEPKIWAWSKEEKDEDNPPFRVATKNIAAQAYLYSPVDDSGVRDYRFEDKLADLESMLAHLWRMLADGCVPLVEGYRKGLALFVANLYLRHPRQRKISKAGVDKFQGAIQAWLDAEGKEYSAIEVIHGEKSQVVTREQFEEQKAKTDNDYHQFFVDSIDDNTFQVASLLLEKRWNVLVSSSGGFITSDNPVCMAGPSGRGLGFGTKGVSISVPLTPDKYLYITDEPGPADRYVPIREWKGDVAEPEAAINFQVFANAYRFIFGPRDLYKVLEEGLKFSENLTYSDRTSPLYALRAEDGSRIRLSRNDTCWCGSGKKYKHCHLPLEREISDNNASLRNITHERLDLELPDI